MALNVDDEWEKFISCVEDEDEEETSDLDEHAENGMISADILSETCPKATDIYISTKTNISYLNQPIDLKGVFWRIPIMNYADARPGVVKKQMKFNSLIPEELELIQNRLLEETCVEENVITSINNPTGRIKFKDIRKISIGISQKDMMSYRCKKKSAFYNCFVMILRMKYLGKFKEFHVKVFNTGKLEIPGIQTEDSFLQILDMVIDILQPYIAEKLEYLPNTTETVLINSNFNCGFYINREALFDILKSKYNIQCIYDPCSYPGIQCKFYYNPKDDSTGSQLPIVELKTENVLVDVSFMIFRTGSVLIVGKCQEPVLMIIYEFLKKILMDEFKQIGIKVPDPSLLNNKNKNKKIRKKFIMTNV
jgi:hypothetical protein